MVRPLSNLSDWVLQPAIVCVMTYLPSSTNIVILGSVTNVLSSGFTPPPITINHTQCGPIINVDREWPYLSVTEPGRLICSI